MVAAVPHAVTETVFSRYLPMWAFWKARPQASQA